MIGQDEDEKTREEERQIYRSHDRIPALRRQLDRFPIYYGIISVLAFTALLIPSANLWTRLTLDLAGASLIISLLGLSPILEPLKKKLPQKYRSLIPDPLMKMNLGLLERDDLAKDQLAKEIAGLEAEQRIAETLRTTFKQQKIKVYSRLDNTCLKVEEDNDADIVAIFPNGRHFTISVKLRSRAKRVFIHRDGRLRLLRDDGKRVPFRDCPAQELIDQEKWLRKNRRNLFLTPGSSVALPSVRILVFAEPTIVGDQSPEQYVSIGSYQFVKVQRGKDFVYLIQENQLCDLVQAVLSLKTK